MTCGIEAFDLNEKLSCPVPAGISPTLVRHAMKTRPCDSMWLVLVLIMVQMNRVHSQDPQWPVHTVCDSERITVTYRSCGEISVTYFRKLILLFTVDTLNEFKVTVYTCYKRFRFQIKAVSFIFSKES